VAKREAAPPTKWEDTERARRLLDIQRQLTELHERLQWVEQRSEPQPTLVTQVTTVRTAITAAEAAKPYELPDPYEPHELPEPHEPPPIPDALAQEGLELKAKQVTLEAAWRELQTLILHGDRHALSLEGLIRLDREDFEAARLREQVTQVEGPIVLRYTFVRPESVTRGRTQELTRLPVARWLIHLLPDGRFVLVVQERRTLEGGARWRWWNDLQFASTAPAKRDRYRGHEDTFHKWAEEAYVECADDSARWISRIHGPMDAAALLSHCDRYFSDTSTFHGPQDEATLPFLLRKMLVEQGHEVPGLVRIVAEE
jgi:hypothetical protein